MNEKPLQLFSKVRERISVNPIHLDLDTQLPQPGYCEKTDSEYVDVELQVFLCL